MTLYKCIQKYIAWITLWQRVIIRVMQCWTFKLQILVSFRYSGKDDTHSRKPENCSVYFVLMCVGQSRQMLSAALLLGLANNKLHYLQSWKVDQKESHSALHLAISGENYFIFESFHIYFLCYYFRSFCSKAY